MCEYHSSQRETSSWVLVAVRWVMFHALGISAQSLISQQNPTKMAIAKLWPSNGRRAVASQCPHGAREMILPSSKCALLFCLGGNGDI